MVRSSLNAVTTNTSCGDSIVIDAPSPVVQTCSATLNADGSVSVAWDEIVGENGYSVRRDGSFVTFVNGLTYTDSPGVGTFQYTIRSRLDGVTTNTTCGGPIVTDDAPPAVQTCSVTLDGDGIATLEWGAIEGENSYVLRRNDAWLTTTSELTHTDVFWQAGDSYVVRSRINGVTTNTTCN